MNLVKNLILIRELSEIGIDAILQNFKISNFWVLMQTIGTTVGA